MNFKSIFSSRNNAVKGQFTSLNNNEMNKLKGGELPPVPPGGGDDYPIDLLSARSTSSTQNTYDSKSIQTLPTLEESTLA